jgi:uncharacterized membrane protein YoaK (UPF0700 family)
MFSTEGGARSNRQNRIVAGYLAFVGGFVNSSGFVVIGTFTSHVTGNVGRLADDAALGNYSGALAALTMVFCFLAGAFAASVTVESHLFARKARAYATALGFEAALLVLFTLVSRATAQAHPGLRDSEALLLCGAMGMQNALVTRLSGAVVRTTHLTGVVTDLGIELARWFWRWRRALSAVARVPLAFERSFSEGPSLPKTALLATVALSFLFGAAFGAVAAVHLRHWAMLFAATAVAACSLYAAIGDRAHDDDPVASRP